MSDTVAVKPVLNILTKGLTFADETLGQLISSSWYVSLDERIGKIADALAEQPEILCCAVLDADLQVVGKIERDAFFSKLSRSFGRDVYAKRPITELMLSPKLFHFAQSIAEVTEQLSQDMKNPQLQHFMAIDDTGGFSGIFSTADLLVFLKNKVDDQAREIAEKNKEILDIARSIQTSLLPKEPQVSGFEILPFMQTAEEVGGDYYDIIRNNNHEWILIGDVSGHGVPAGLVMMMTQTALHSIIHMHPEFSVSQILGQVNEIITKNLRTMGMNKYMTGTLFHHDGNGLLTYAGMHQDLLIYRRALGKVECIETNGSWIGYADLMNEFPLNQIEMGEGDLLFLFTDGITEAQRDDGTPLDLQGLVELLEKFGDQGLAILQQKILASFENLKIDDDYTFVIIQKK